MSIITYSQAIYNAMREEMDRDPNVILIGEDVGTFGGVWGVSGDLVKIYGEDRVRDTPISEAAIVGAGLGAAMVGMRPIVEIMFGDFLPVAGDQLVNQLAKARYMSGGKASVPVTVRVTTGAPGSSAAQHSQSPEGWYMNVPGLKIAVPATPADAKGLLKTALRGEDPVLFFEHKMLYAVKGEVPDDPDFMVPFGQAQISRPGKRPDHRGDRRDAAEGARSRGDSGKRGHRRRSRRPPHACAARQGDDRRVGQEDQQLLIVHEAHKRLGPGAEIAAMIAEEAIGYLDGPIVRVAAKNVPLPYSPDLENTVLPSCEDIVEKARGLARGKL